jgi:hypothetical protein
LDRELWLNDHAITLTCVDNGITVVGGGYAITPIVRHYPAIHTFVQSIQLKTHGLLPIPW